MRERDFPENHGDLLRLEAAALQPWVDPFGRGLPQALVGPHKRIDFVVGQVNPLIAQRGQRFHGLFDEAPPELFVGDDLPDQQLNCSLRHWSAIPMAANAMRIPRGFRAIGPKPRDSCRWRCMPTPNLRICAHDGD